MSRRNQHKYSKLGEAALKLSDAYKTNVGQIVEGGLKGGLGATIAGMSAVADNGMLGVHVALGLIWLTMVTKDYAQAFSNQLAKTPEILSDIGVEIFLYSQLMAEKMQSEGSDNRNQNEFTRAVNKNLFEAINKTLKNSGYPEIAEISEIDEIPDIESRVNALSSKEDFLTFLKEKTEISNEKLLTGIAAVGAAATVGGAIGIAASGKATGAIITAAAGAGTTAAVGGILLAKSGSAKKIAQKLYESVSNLNSSQNFPDIDIDKKREEIVAGQQMITIENLVRKREGENRVHPLQNSDNHLHTTAV